MIAYCGEKSVMLAHYVKALLERFFVILGCHPLRKVVCKNSMRVYEQHTIFIAFPHDFDTPVKISRKAIGQVI